MDDDISIIESNTRKEKIKNFLFENKKKIIIFFVAIILIVVSFFGYGEFIKIQNDEGSIEEQWTGNYVFENEWQSFRGKKGLEELEFKSSEREIILFDNNNF